MAGQGVPPEAQAPVDGGQDQLTDLVTNVSGGMSMFLELVSAAGLDPKSLQQLEAAQQAYQGAVEQALAGGGQGMAPAGQGIASPEAGANPNAVPAGAMTR